MPLLEMARVKLITIIRDNILRDVEYGYTSFHHNHLMLLDVMVANSLAFAHLVKFLTTTTMNFTLPLLGGKGSTRLKPYVKMTTRTLKG